MRRVVTAISVALVVGFCYWFWYALEWKEEEVDRGFTDAARQNPMLAAEQFLQSMDRDTESRRGFSLLDQIGTDASPVGDGDNLVLINAHRTLSRERLEVLWQWVHKGGHLMASASNRFLGNSNPERDLLLARLGVSLVDEFETMMRLKDNPPQEIELDSGRALIRAAEESREPPQAQEAAPAVQPGCSFGTVAVAFDDLEQPLQVDWYGLHSLIDEANWASGQANTRFGAKLLQFELGDGMITLTTDNQIWNNHNIGCHDHAYLLWLLTGSADKTWFAINQDAPSLWAILWRAAPYGIIFSLLALVVWLWKQPVRFGPVLVHTELDRRRFLEHAEANAAFLWRHGRQHTLISGLRDDIKQRLRRRHRGFDELEGAMQVNLLSRITLLPAPLITQAMLADGGDSEQDFVQTIAQLQQIRSRL